MDDKEKNVYDAYEKIAELYDKELWDDMPYNQQIDFFLSLVKGKNILDVGCAMGSFTKYVADKKFTVDGIDFSPKMIDIAKKKVNNANFYIMNMLNITLDKKYNGLMAINSIIHIEKKKMFQVIENFRNTIAEDGIIFLILQEGNGEQFLEEPLDTSIKEFVNFYKEEEIKEIFKQCNLDIIKMERIKVEGENELGNDQLVFYLKKGEDRSSYV